MITGRFKPGEVLVFIASIEGVCRINKGDRAIYLGNSQARIVGGPSSGWLVTLCADAPVTKRGARGDSPARRGSMVVKLIEVRQSLDRGLPELWGLVHGAEIVEKHEGLDGYHRWYRIRFDGSNAARVEALLGELY